MAGRMRTGVGGWVFPPWRGVFYPRGLKQADELAFASRALGAIEINATFAAFQKRALFARWADQTPEDFVFTLKAHRMCVNRRVLAEAGEAIGLFIGQGIAALGPRLGPILWQFSHTKAFDPPDIAAFLELLPREAEGLPLRHAIEPRHASFADPRFAELCRARGAAIVLLDHAGHAPIEAATAGFAYVRLVQGRDEVETGYEAGALDAWAAKLAAIARDGREVFAFFINEGKLRAPAAAMALAERLAALG
jgi:uncharacterized protein YecE (DUF72 family)